MGAEKEEKNQARRVGVLGVARRPLAPAAVGMASVLLAGGAKAQEGGIALPTIDVQGDTGGYRATQSTLTRLPTPLRDTPQSVNVVTQQVIQEQNTGDVKDALRNVAGITFRAGEGGNQGDTPYLRGFTAQNDIFRDGVRDPGWYTRDTFSVESVEVYKGPSSVLFGRGSTAGIINLTTKTPVDRDFVEGVVTGNTGPGVRATVDANRKINDNVTARIQVMGQSYDTPGRDHVDVDRWGVAPSMNVKLGERTKLTMSYIFQHDNNIPDYGIPFLSALWGVPRSVAPVSRNNWYGILSQPYPDVEQVDAHVGTIKLEHEFNNQVKVTNTTRYVDVDRFQRNVFPEPNTPASGFPSPPDLNSNWTPNRAQVAVTNTLIANQTDFLVRFSTGSFEHTMTAGLDANRETRDFLRNQFAGQGATNFLVPNPWRAPGTPQPPTASQLTNGDAQDLGAYAADQMKINRYLEVLGSARFDQYQFTQDAPLAVASVQHLEHTDNVTSWRVGAVGHPTPLSSVYVMHGTSFNPSYDNLTISVSTPATALSQIALGPEKNETTEVGAKADVLDGKISLATAIYQTEKTNLRVPDPANSTVTILNGLVRARGFEWSAVGKLTDQWYLIASYSYVDARIVRTTVPAQLNNHPMNTPANAFSLWTTYDVTPRFQLGGGAFYNGSVWGDLPNTAKVPDWWRFDAMAAYKLTANATLQFNIYNIFDKYYFTSAYSNWAVPGLSRTAALTLRVRF